MNTKDNEEESSGHRSSSIKVRCDAWTKSLVEPFNFTIRYVDHDIAGKSVGTYNRQLISRHGPGDDQLILPTNTSIVDSTTL